MESNEPGSVEDSLDSKNVEAAVVEDMVTKYEDPVALSGHVNEEDQSGEQVYGYLYRSAGSEDATIYVDSRGFNLNGQSLIVTQNDDGNEIIVLVGEDPDGAPLDHTFAQLQSEDVTFEEGLKEHGALVVDEHSQGLEFIKSSEEVSEEVEERHVYIENSGEVLNISNDNVGSPDNVESPSLWSVSNSGRLKNDGTEMLFIPDPSFSLAVPHTHEQTKHPKLMQLASIAHELQLADQKGSSTGMSDYVKDTETVSVVEYDKIIQSDEDDKSLSSEREKCINLSFKSSKTASSVLAGLSGRVVDNTVSVIHSTSSSDVQGTSPENQSKLGLPSDFISEKNLQNSELPSEVLYSNISSVTLHDNLDRSSGSKPAEECSRQSSEENSQSLIPGGIDQRCSEQGSHLELNNNDSPLTFIDKTHNLDVDHLNTEDNIMGDHDSDMKMDEDSHANSSDLVIEDENPVSDESDSDLSLTQCNLSKEIDMSERMPQAVPDETHSNTDDDNRSSTEHSASVSENEHSFFSSQYSMFSYKKRVLKQSLQRTSPVLQDEIPPVDNEPVHLTESSAKELKVDETQPSMHLKLDTVHSEQSSSNHLESDLVIAEAAEESNPCDAADEAEDDYVFRDEEPDDVGMIRTAPLISTLKASSSLRSKTNHETLPISGTGHEEQSNDHESVDRSVLVNSNSSPANNAEESSDSERLSSVKKPVKRTRVRSPDDYSSSEERLPLRNTKKTYLSFKRYKKHLIENKINKEGEKIVLYSDDINDFDNDTETTPGTRKSHDDSPSTSQTSMMEIDESSLVSRVSATRTYMNSGSKEKSLLRKKRLVKQSLRSHSLRTRTMSSTLPLNNGNVEVSDNDLQNLSNSDNIPWGKMLLETSFEPCTVPNDAPSTSFAPQYPSETSSTSVMSPEQRRKQNKAKRDFDRLLNNSSPVATKQPKIGKKKFSRTHPNVIKATKSRYSSSHFSRLPKSSSSALSSRSHSGNSSRTITTKKMLVKGREKKANIQYMDQQPSEHAQRLSELSCSMSKREMYSCSSCNFSSIYVDNLMEHLKYCVNRQPIFDYEVNNMDKRQRIRGEEEIKENVQNTLTQIKNDFRANFVEEEHPSLQQLIENERESDRARKKKSLFRQYGYGDDDVVWVKFKDRFWPALVCSTDGLTAYVKLIGYPKEAKGLKVKHENIRTFDNSKWNLHCLEEAQSLPHKDMFTKAVHSSVKFTSRKLLGVKMTGKEFFSVRDEVDFATDSASSDSVGNVDTDSELEMTVAEPARKSRYEKLDLPRIYNHLIQGNADEYVLEIYSKKRPSEKNQVFFNKRRSPDLKPKPWFGPFEDKKQQDELFSHFRDLFTKRVGMRTYLPQYVCQVMIPEAIVQAISVVKGIPLRDAELLFESEDSMDLDNEDYSVEDIIKKYS